MDSKEFRDFIDDASIVSDAVALKAAENLLLLTAGDTGRKVDIELKQGSDILVSMNIKEPASSIYSVEYMKKMAKAASFADSVKVNFSSDYPLRLDFKALNQAQMSFILAPRIENK
jgi:proliferating cell nuclear antigen